MKVLQLASGDLWAGAEVQLYHMTCKMHMLETIEVVVVLLNHGQLERELILKGIKVIVLDELKYNVFHLISKLNLIIKNFNVDIVHTHRTKENIIGGASAFITKCKSIRTAHGLSEFNRPAYDFKKITYSFADKFIGRYFQQRVVSVSDDLKVKLTNYFPKSHISVINNCVNIEYIEEMAKANIDFKFSNNQFNVCFIGRFAAIKRADLFYDFAKEFITNRTELNVHFYMIGDGPFWDDLKKQSIIDKLETKLTLTGFVENTAPYLKNMDLLVFTSDHEGLPMTLLESMVLNVPVMARNNLKTIKEVLCNGECGLVDITDNPSDFSDKLDYAMNNQDELVRKAAMAKDIVKTNYSIEKNVAKYIDLYNDIL